MAKVNDKLEKFNVLSSAHFERYNNLNKYNKTNIVIKVLKNVYQYIKLLI